CFLSQAEDGIRAFHVTGVQTCALPTWADPAQADARIVAANGPEHVVVRCGVGDVLHDLPYRILAIRAAERERDRPSPQIEQVTQIGRASCRERVETPLAAVTGAHAQS